jgi:hypothetical protein
MIRREYYRSGHSMYSLGYLSHMHRCTRTIQPRTDEFSYSTHSIICMHIQSHEIDKWTLNLQTYQYIDACVCMCVKDVSTSLYKYITIQCMRSPSNSPKVTVSLSQGQGNGQGYLP